MKLFVLLTCLFIFFSCSETPNDVPIDSYRDIEINVDMNKAIADGLFEVNVDTLTLFLDLFDKLLVTDVIKAHTGFLDKSLHKEIIKTSMNIYRGFDSSIPKPTKPKPTPPDHTKNNGLGYLLKFAGGLWKMGIVYDYKEKERRHKEHINDSIGKVYEFTNINIEHRTATIFYETGPISNPKGWEEKVGEILLKYNDNIANTLQPPKSKNYR